MVMLEDIGPSLQDASRAFKQLLAKGIVPEAGKETWESCLSRKMQTGFITQTMGQAGREWVFDHEAPMIKNTYGKIMTHSPSNPPDGVNMVLI